jgi:hypothetical protein
VVDERADSACVREAVIQIGTNAGLWAGIERSITAIQCVPDYLSAKLSDAHDPTQIAALTQLITQTNEAVGLLHDDRKSGYRLFFNYSLIANWAYFEAFVDDFVGTRLAANPELIERLSQSFPKARPAAWTIATISSYLGNAGYKKSSDFAAFLEKLFELVCVQPLGLTSQDRQALNFANAARNCLLHNGGKWHAKGCIAAGLPPSSVGQQIVLARQNFLDCYDAICKVLVTSSRLIDEEVREE